MTRTDPPLRIAYLTDSMADIRNIEGLGTRAAVTFVAPEALGDRASNFWPPRPPATADKVLLAGGRLGFNLRAARWLHRRRQSFDVVFVLDNLTAAFAATLARALGGPPVVIAIGRPTLDYIKCQPRGLGWAARFALAWLLVQVNERRADGIGAVSDYCAAQCRRRNDNVRSIPAYGVDTQHFQPRLGRAEARRQLGLPLDVPVVMWRSRFAPEKDPATFLRAVQRLRDAGRQLTAVYMGGEIEEMNAVARELGVEIVSRKPTDVAEIPVWYEAADVDVQTSWSEGLGISPLEALASGTPVVVTDVGGLPQVVDGGRVGALVPVADDAALAVAIARYLDDPDLATRHAEAGRQWVMERFAVDATFDAWVDLAQSVARPAAVPRTLPLRVLFVDHEVRLSGGQRDLVDLVRALDPAAVEIHVALPGSGPLADALRAHGALVHTVAMGEGLRKVSRWDLATRPWSVATRIADAARSANDLTRLARRLQPDVIHTNSMKAHVLSIRAARAVDAPLVWHIRDILQPGWLQRAIVRTARVAAARVVSLSEVAAAPFRSGSLARRVRVVHNGVRPEPLDAEEARRWRDKLGTGADDVLVVLVGQIAAWKGQDVFVEAAALVASRNDRARFAVVGECLFPENEGDFDRRIRDRARELGLDGRFAFPGPAPTIEPVMAAADIVVHASRLPEPFGRVIVEAMAQGRPVITTTEGSGPELVPLTAGRRVPPGDPQALAAAIEELAGDGQLRGRLGEAAREVASRYDIAATGAGVMAVWEELVR